MTHGYLDGLFICDSGFRAHLSMQTGLKRAHNAARALLTSHRNCEKRRKSWSDLSFLLVSLGGCVRYLP
jgi:hypothetical protein